MNEWMSEWVNEWMNEGIYLMCENCDLTWFDGAWRFAMRAVRGVRQWRRTACLVSAKVPVVRAIGFSVDSVDPPPQWRLFGSSWPKWRAWLCWAGLRKTCISSMCVDLYLLIFLSYIHIKIREVADVATQQFGVHVGELGVATDSLFVWWKRKTLGKQRVTLHFDSSLTWACLAEKACAHRPEILLTSNQCCQPNWGLGIGSWTTWAANLANLLYAFGNAIGVVAPGDGARSCRRMAEKDVKD